MRKAFVAGVVGLALFSFSLLAQQSAFVLPGAFGANSTVTGFSAFPFAQSGVFSASSGAFLVLASADGTKFYIISNSPSNTVMVTGTLFSNVQAVAGFPGGASAAALTPDGRRLLVAAGNLQVINTQSDTLATASGVSVGGTAIDVAVSIDSTKAYVLVNTGGSFRLVILDLTNLQVLNTLPIAGQATGVAVGPNGLVYVGATNQELELDPENLVVRNTMSVNGLPAKLSFTPDGKLGLAPNQTPITGSAIMIFDLVAKRQSGSVSTAVIPATVTIGNVYPVSNSRVFAFAPNTQTLYDVSLTALTASSFQFSLAGSVTAAATSSDIATVLHNTTQFLFYTSGNILYEFDLAANLIVGQLAFTGSGGALSVATPANTAGVPAGILTYGDQQTVAKASTTAPLAVRVFDASGNPVAGSAVTFSTSSSGVTLQRTSATTNKDGLASTTATVPNSAGSVNVSVSTDGGFSANFTINVGSSNPGGGGGTPTPTGGLTVIAGQGSMIKEATSTVASNATMTVLFADANGNPLVNQTITFTVTSGNGTLQCPVTTSFFNCIIGVNNLTVSTDANGMAQADYLASFVSAVVGVNAATINASAPSGASVTFFVTAVSATSSPQATLIAPQIGTVLKGNAGQTIPGAVKVQVTGGSGQPIPNVSLRILNPPDPAKGPSATCDGTFALTDLNGVASCDLDAGGKTGTAQLTAEAGYAFDFGPITVTVGPGAPANVNIVQGNNQSGKPGATLPLALLVQVTDAFSNVLGGTPVSWKVLTPGAVTLTQTSTATDTSGRASTLVTIGSFSGTAQVQVTAGSASATFSITVSVPISGLQIVSGNNQSGPLSTQFSIPLTVKVTDAQSNAVQNVTVTFTITSGSGSVSNPSPTTDATGSASTAITAGNTAGSIVVTATAAGFSVTFNLTAIPPGPSGLVVFNAASLQAPISAGAIVTIQGQGIAVGVQGVVTPNTIIGPLPFTLAGDSVKFNSVAAPIFSVSNVNGVQQINVQVPYEVAGRTVADLTVTISGGGSATVSVNLQPFAPAVFETTLFGIAHQAVAIRPDGSYVSPANPARRGEVIIIFLTGLGQTTPAIGTNDSGVPNQNVAAQVVVGLNNAGVPLVSAQSVVGLVGVYAVALQVPSNTTPGSQQPVGFIIYDSAGNAYYGQATFLPIQ
ncbi:MAG: Ig-like domain-containing protein [Acidobacteriia bacterium]|nr:Ig-like domain-containing protein [Terriglobia bacterium]